MNRRSGANQINQAIQQLDQVIQQNAAASEEMASTSEELLSQAEQLQNTIGFFKIADSGGDSAKVSGPGAIKEDDPSVWNRVKPASQEFKKLARINPARVMAAMPDDAEGRG